jgi:hypothetical protein
VWLNIVDENSVHIIQQTPLLDTNVNKTKRRTLGESSAMVLLSLFLAVFLGSLSTVSPLPSGFIDEGVLSREAIITGAFAPNPRNGNKPMLILSTKNGNIYVQEDPDNSEENFLIGDFTGYLCTNGERGLQSITVHPNFTENYSIYLFYSNAVIDCPEWSSQPGITV